jgi:glycosyltransferase involved in cell wall biosynthesis
LFHEGHRLSTSTIPITKTIKVLQLGSPTGLYGAERWILALVKNLDPQKVTSIIGVIKDDPDQNAPLCKEAEALGFQTEYFEGQGRINFSVIKRLRRFVLKQDIAILHTHFYKTDIIGFLATRGTQCKIISTPHGWTQNPDSKLRIFELLDRLMFPFLDTVAPLSEKMLQPLQNVPMLKRKLHLINNGVDIEEITSENNINEELLTWKRDGKYIIGYIGRLVKGKGLDTLISALANLKGLNWRLAVIGEGEEERALRILAEQMNLSDKIRFFGFRPDRISFLNGFDIFVLPSRSEGTPRCVMEAMAAKIPVIASDIPGCRNLITDKQTGRLFQVDSSEKLAETILHAHNERPETERIVLKAYNFILDNFSAARMAKEYESLFLKTSS